MGSKKNKKAPKKKKLRGIALARNEAEKLAKTQCDDGDKSNEHASISIPSELSESSMANNFSAKNTSASETKFGTAASQFSVFRSTDQVIYREGFVLIDVELLCAYLDTVSKCKNCNGTLDTKPSYAKQQGFAMPFVGHCHVCDNDTVLFNTSSMCKKDGILSGIKTKTPNEVNVRMICFAKAIGREQSCLDTFCKCLNMPEALHWKAYESLMEHHHKAAVKVATESMRKAGEEVKANFGTDIGVSVDGSWQRRGHASQNGIVTAVSIDTGKCLDVEIMSNTCKECLIWKKKEGTPEYIDWKASHQSRCAINHSGSAGSMEPEGAKKIFGRSISKHDLKYVNYLGDRDSASFKTVANSQPYGDIETNKLECVGHVQKRLGSRLRKLCTQKKGKKLSDGKLLSGAGRLTNRKIDTMQN